MVESRFRFIAFYLPQYHPVRENDTWWGKGFTDWTNVAQARPIVAGQYQPHIPADLGFYDLRLPEVRCAQAILAAQHEIDAFCYYHYWFEGHRVLSRPFDEVLQSREPRFPFLLCWANENWTRNWNGAAREVLMRQTYSQADDLAHIRWLLTAFADDRYLRVDGRPVFLVYRPAHLPDPRRTMETWRREAARLGVGELYLCGVQNLRPDRQDPATFGLDAAVQFAPDRGHLGPSAASWLPRRVVRRVLRPNSPYRKHNIREYRRTVTATLGEPQPPYRRYPCVSPGFDSTPRRRAGGSLVLLNSTPALYGAWLDEVLRRFSPPSGDENLVFVNAWNEWGEGNHLEPDLRWGHAYLESHARVARAHDMRGQPRSLHRPTLSTGTAP